MWGAIVVSSGKQKPRLSPGTHWTNHRGQVFVSIPTHPMARADGLYPRARLAMEAKIGRILRVAERVYHVDNDPANDDPNNLWLFPDQRELAQDRSLRYHELKASLGGGLAALTPAQRQHQLNMAEERLIIREAREADEREQQRLTKLRASARRRAEERAAAKASHRRPTSPRQAKHEEAKAVPA
jgi:hypothetical protein